MKRGPSPQAVGTHLNGDPLGEWEFPQALGKCNGDTWGQRGSCGVNGTTPEGWGPLLRHWGPLRDNGDPLGKWEPPKPCSPP